jgi:glyoxylase I family protein
MCTVAGIHHIAIISKSERSVSFYKEIGFKEVFRKDRRYDIIVILEGYGIKLEIFIDPSHPDRATSLEQIGLRHLAFKVNNIDEIAKHFHREIISKDWIGEKYFFISDPDGLPIEFHE